ncbi:MAG: MMPL family transporter [Actinobacteria bacterium]|nr:MMPL family transporter [Actinomycetota bacterium]
MTLQALARWCFRRRRLVLLLWIGAFVLINVIGGVIGSSYTDNFNGGKGDAQAAFDLLQTRFPARAGDTADVVFASDQGVTRGEVVDAANALLDGVKGTPHVTGVERPSQFGRVSPDGTVAYGTVTYDEQAGDLPAKTAQPLIDAVNKVKVPGLKVELSGEVVSRALQPPQEPTELIGLLAAIVILFLAFGSFLAMGMPIITAIFGVGIGSVFVALLGHVITVPSFAPQVALMIGLGVGIDYALFIVTRHRTGLHDGLSPEDATVLALTTAGRAVLFAGSTVIISLLGMFLMGISFIYGLSLGAVLAVLMTMAASVTLLPAIMGFAGQKLAGKERKERKHHRETWAYRWSRQIQKRPWIMAVVSLAILLTMAMPLLSIRLGVSDHGNDPTSLTTRRAYDLLAKGFGPGFNGPILLAADLTGSTTKDSVAAFADSLRADPDIAFVAPMTVNDAGNAAVVPVISKSAPQDAATSRLVHHLRAEIRDKGFNMHTGSVTAFGIDAADQVGARLPIMVTAVILLSFLLLMAVFRSVLVAVKAGVMNLLSIGAAYGVIVAIFQWGWLSDVVGIGRPGPIEFWVPMMLFTILFGLSMDYEVFLLSRVREEYLLSGNNAEAVADGLAATARVITAAAAIMIAVFSSFVLGDLRVLKLLGLGLATAVFIDATLVRMVLVPATMELLGDANWWLPKWLDRLVPRISVEAPPAVAAQVAATTAAPRVAVGAKGRRERPLVAAGRQRKS